MAQRAPLSHITYEKLKIDFFYHKKVHYVGHFSFSMDLRIIHKGIVCC